MSSIKLSGDNPFELNLNVVCERDYPQIASHLIQLFHSSLLVRNECLPLKLRKVVKTSLCRFREIQSALNHNEELLQKRHVKAWLQADRVFTTVVDPQEKLEHEILRSYMILPFPRQETEGREVRHLPQIEYWNQELIRAESLLYRYFEEDAISLEIEDRLLLHRLLYFHPAFFEDRKGLLWIHLLQKWADPERLSVLVSSFWNTPPVELPNGFEFEGGSSLSLRTAVISLSIHAMQASLGVTFSDYLTRQLSKHMIEIEVRHDVVYFLRHLKSYKPKGHKSDFVLQRFQIYDAYAAYIPEVDKTLFLDLVFLSHGEQDPIWIPYLPQNLKHLSATTVENAWQAIRDRAVHVVKEQTQNQLIFLLGFFSDHAHYIEKFSYEVLEPSEIIKFLSKNPISRQTRALAYTYDNEIQDFEEGLSFVTQKFSSEQKVFLYAQDPEENYQACLTFLQNLSARLRKRLDTEIAFHFLMSDFQIVDSLKKLNKCLETEINMQTLSSEVYVQLSTLARDYDQNIICSQLQESLISLLDSDQN